MTDPSTVPLPPSRDSLDYPRPPSLANGVAALSLDPVHEDQGGAVPPQDEEEEGEYPVEDAEERIRRLEDELSRTRDEKEQFEAQYRSLLGKLTNMRNTLGDKLKQDADELDRREQEISDLRAANEDLTASVETLRLELIQTNDDAEHAHSELEQLRLRAFDSQKLTSEEASERELALRDAQEDLERVRMEREEWEGEAMRERVRREELVTRLGQVEMELGVAKSEREVLREERDREAESASNLHAVLEEFQAAKERELESTLGDLQAQLHASNDSLAAYKKRATTAEANLAAAQNDSEKVLMLTKQVKDQSLLTGKLRHEAVILNEHLTEALRRLKKDSNENSVDRRLVSNVLITFLNTPRADTKRFEMLQLISSILSWTDDQREQVGLQRSSGLSAPGVIASGSRGGAKGHARSGKGKAVDDLGENESFSDLWIEFLLKESQAGAQQGGTGISSPSKSPGNTTPGSPLSPASPNGLSSHRNFILPDLGSPPPPPAPAPAPAPAPRRPSLTSFFGGGSRAAAAAPPQTPGSVKEEP
ncbi:hypothetical protein BCR35DRAFT_298211 [Leucosporidium creatinivorum]|uniref:GRIP domain-containing protein n=1 Tax=Leucosporidium creatinivorum TaxID=106004 RepID=A0A1Y2G5T0_9BASI|nr:hypothetical protein BCR35DRAFT_298211 [Leucosporidium creatinivorum]